MGIKQWMKNHFTQKLKEMKKEYQCKVCYFETDDREEIRNHVKREHHIRFNKYPELRDGKMIPPQSVSDFIWKRSE